MSVKRTTTVKEFTSVAVADRSISGFYKSLQFNKKKPKYNYLSGIVTGIIVSAVAQLKGMEEGGEKKTDKTYQRIQKIVTDSVEQLVTTYNWNMNDLRNLNEEFFGGDDDDD